MFYFILLTSSEQICCHQDSLLEVFKLLVSRQSLLLGHTTMDCNGGEVLLNQ